MSFSRKLSFTALIIVGLLSQNAHAGSIRQWTDPETGEVTFGDAPTDAAARHIRVQPSKGLANVFCNNDCAREVTGINLTELTAKFRKDAKCKVSWYKGDVFGKQLALRAKDECADSKARRELGLPGNSGSAQAEYAEHFEREGERRNRQTDRAIQLNEGWQNRQAMDRNTRAIEDIGKRPILARDNLGRLILPYGR